MEYLLSYQQIKMSDLSVIPASPNVNFWAGKQQTRCCAICQTNNSRMAQSSTAAPGQVVFLRQAIVAVA